jgi:hypothetical protein
MIVYGYESGKTGILSTFTKRPQLGLRKTNHPKAIKKHSLLTNTFVKLIRQLEQDGKVELTARSNKKGKNQIFYVKFPLSLFNKYSADQKIPKDRLLNQVEVRLGDKANEFETLKTLTTTLNKGTLDDSSKAILALAVENVVDQYRGATALKKLHKS